MESREKDICMLILSTVKILSIPQKRSVPTVRFKSLTFVEEGNHGQVLAQSIGFRIVLRLSSALAWVCEGREKG